MSCWCASGKTKRRNLLLGERRTRDSSTSGLLRRGMGGRLARVCLPASFWSGKGSPCSNSVGALARHIANWRATSPSLFAILHKAEALSRRRAWPSCPSPQQWKEGLPQCTMHANWALFLRLCKPQHTTRNVQGHKEKNAAGAETEEEAG